MKSLQKFLAKLDHFQRSHTWLAFPLAVVKKYGDDNASNYGAIITYYAFLSLFPLLFVTTASLQLLLRHDVHLQTTILTHIDNSFPLVGAQLRGNIHDVGKTGLALLISLGVTFYGARGAADAVRQTLDGLWHIPKAERAGFPKSTAKSLLMILVGGGAIIATALLSSYATSLGHAAFFKVAFTLVSFVLLAAALFFVQYIGISTGSKSGHLLLSAIVAAVGSQILQTFGGYIMTHELHQLNSPYGAFSITLGLLFWIYLQVEVLLYAIEIGVVRQRKLWPRRMFGE